MRRILAVLASAVLTAALVALTPATAHAARGTLLINGKWYDDPHGCYNAVIWPLLVDNHTNEPVFVLNDSNCRGAILGEVRPKSARAFDHGASLYIP
ncbi:hypothetical protein ACFO4E_09485 [Nocardiopsis mangrovi]|uniref:Uncharacterized protein n=1 Tax=Nocardiopsis mangrovi TaxID=1179818 RepID=A0ABV9DVA6_9ACTN